MNKTYTFKNLSLLKIFLKQEAETNLLLEICGLLSFRDGLYIYKRMENFSDKSSTFFKIKPTDYLKFLNEYGCFCVFHSHLLSDENFSKADAENSENCCKLFLIYSVITEKFKFYEPKNKDYDVNIAKELINFL